ncbi:hypothetical protein K435DRAFT_848937 [Dendrothele bispora CBS 962.96]|uniref:Uncharacterized protein n=1 Tax=Dendrothele bispora (strain CBS 962.96) TaxID=1314807 RepID=A0A4S8MU37_DENBC|nr:hypothetical protein K435DRAFT_848937 [Dendrothele bispora CBS 962.96]
MVRKVFDNRDTRDLEYSSDWFVDGFWNTPTDSGTLSSTNSPSASVSFTFPGKHEVYWIAHTIFVSSHPPVTEPARAFFYYGMKRSNGGLYHICIDGCGTGSLDSVDIDALDRSDNGQNPPTLLYSFTFDDFGIHQILLTNQNDTRTVPSGNSQITLDRLELEVQDPGSSTPSTFSTSTSTSTSDSPAASPSSSSVSTSSASVNTSPTVTSQASTSSSSSSSSPVSPPPFSFLASSSSLRSLSSSPLPTTSSLPFPSSDKSVPAGPVAGGVTGGLALLLLCAFLVLCMRRRRSRANQKYMFAVNDQLFLPPPEASAIGNPSSVTGLSSSQPVTNRENNPSSATGLSSSEPITNREKQGLDFSPETASSSDQFITNTPPAPSRTQSHQPRRESDILTNYFTGPVSGDTEVLPPGYDQIFGNNHP